MKVRTEASDSGKAVASVQAKFRTRISEIGSFLGLRNRNIGSEGEVQDWNIGGGRIP